MIYNYKCLECGTVYEKTHGMNLAPEFKCEVETCDGVLVKVPVPVNFKINGYRESNGYTRMETETVSAKEFSEQLST